MDRFSTKRRRWLIFSKSFSGKQIAIFPNLFQFFPISSNISQLNPNISQLIPNVSQLIPNISH